MHKYRTNTCGELGVKDLDKIVKLAGWVQSNRDLGGVVFLDIRDHYGLTQVVIPTEKREELLYDVTKESTISVTGTVQHRFSGNVNPNMATGEIEILASEIAVLSKVAETIPFEINPPNEVREDIRLKYRFLDLRREKLHNNIVLRSKVINYMRQKMNELNFLEIQTPILTSSSPEGARDYLVPSRVHPGKFYALPQAPQQFKQLLMASGFDKYFQIAPCFRDEDARADRSPGEFYQLDIEMAFATQEDVFEVVQKVLYDVFKEFSDNTVAEYPFPKIPYRESMLKYGSDKPDLRNPLIIYDLSEMFVKSGFKAFEGKTVRVIPVKDCSSQPRRFLDKIVDFAKAEGANGMSWLKVNGDMSLSGSIAKFLDATTQKEIIQHVDAEEGYVLFFIADEEKTATKLAGLVRTELGTQLDLIEKDVFKFCWIIDFPMFELNPETNAIEFSHNPFSLPQGGFDALNNTNPLDILAYQYDIVCNGYELSSGAVRNHNINLMLKAFEIANYSKEEVQNKFGALYNAFQFGAPPHAGIAPGIDRIIMLLANESSIREVIAFPMNPRAQDLLMNAPCEVTQKQLREVHIKTNIE